MIDRYFPLVKALHSDLLSIRNQFSSIPDSDAASRMLSPTRIMLAFRLLCETLSVMGSIYKTDFDKFCQNVGPLDGIPSHSLVGMYSIRLHDVPSTFANVFVILLHQGGCSQIFLDLSS